MACLSWTHAIFFPALKMKGLLFSTLPHLLRFVGYRLLQCPSYLSGELTSKAYAHPPNQPRLRAWICKTLNGQLDGFLKKSLPCSLCCGCSHPVTIICTINSMERPLSAQRQANPPQSYKFLERRAGLLYFFDPLWCLAQCRVPRRYSNIC